MIITPSRTALITGASSGIGAAFARSLASKGYVLVLVARREARLRSLADKVERKFNVQARVFPADLSDPAQVKRLEIQVAEIHGLEILINNAGFGVPGKFADIEAEPGSSPRFFQFLWMTAEDVVSESLDSLGKNHALCIPGFNNRLFVGIIRNRLGAFAVKKLAARFQK